MVISLALFGHEIFTLVIQRDEEDLPVVHSTGDTEIAEPPIEYELGYGFQPPLHS